MAKKPVKLKREIEKISVYTAIMRVTVSFIAIGAGLFFLFTSQDQALRETASGWIGLVIGYWLD